MENPSGPRPGKLSSSGLPRGRPPKHTLPQEATRPATAPSENHKHGAVCGERAEGKKKGRPRVDLHELRSIPAHMMVQWKEEFKRRSRVKCPYSGCWLEFPSIYGLKYHYQRCQGAPIAEKMSHACGHCEAVFATKVRLQKHVVWNHTDQLSGQPREQPKLHKSPTKASLNSGLKKRPTENSPPSPVFFKVKKTHEVSSPSQNGEVAPPQGERRPPAHHGPPAQRDRSPQSTSSDAGGSESDGGSLPPLFHDEDPERMRHRRKQKTPKKFTGEQPSISGTFGLKGMTKAEEKLKAGRGKRQEGGGGQGEEPQRRASAAASRRDPLPLSSGPHVDTQWQHAISERGEVVCPTCGIVTRKTVSGLKKHMEICQKLQDALKCQHCQKQFRSKAGLNYHVMAEHNSTPSRSEGQAGDEQEERERLRRVLKQMGRIKCPSEGCSAHFSSLMGYQYHQKRCGRELTEDEKPVFLCPHCGKSYRSKAGRDYHLRTEHPAPAPAAAHRNTATTNNNTVNNNNAANNNNSHNTSDHNTATNNNSSSSLATEKARSADEAPSGGRREPPPPERKDWQELPPVGRPRERAREGQERDGEKERTAEAPGERHQEGPGEDFERTPSGRVRRRSAQVAVFHLQEIAEDELAKDWGTKRRIKDDLVPDSKRLNYTRPGLPNFSPKLLETWKNEVKEKGFICCSNVGCEAVYSSVSGLKAHLANCNQAGGELGKYTCLICQKEFSSESGVKYHISKSHSQNWFRAAPHALPTHKSKPPEVNGLQAEVRNGTVPGKKRGRKPKERPPEAAPLPAQTPAPLAPPNSTSPPPAPAAEPTPAPTALSTDKGSPSHNRQPSPPSTRRGKPKRVPFME